MATPPNKSAAYGLPPLEDFHHIQTFQFNRTQYVEFCRALRKSPRLINLVGMRSDNSEKWIDMATECDDYLDMSADAILEDFYYPARWIIEDRNYRCDRWWHKDEDD